VASLGRTLVRAERRAVDQPSRRVYAPAQAALLAVRRDRIAIVELEGALFFGSVERLADRVDAVPPDVRTLVLDLRRVSTIDESGAVLLEQLNQRLKDRGLRLMLAGVPEGGHHAESLRRFAAFPADAQADWYPDADRAIEAGELALLAEAGAPAIDQPLPLEASSLAQSLAPPQLQRLVQVLEARTLAAGEVLFREGDPGDRLYVLTRGSVSIVGADGHRYVSYSPGAMFGETAMLDGRGRSAGAVADTPAVVHALSRADFDHLQSEAPELVAQVLRNVAVHLAERLRTASNAWQASAR
jgi:ABC-type transporter Mla MlaB component